MVIAQRGRCRESKLGATTSALINDETSFILGIFHREIQVIISESLILTGQTSEALPL